MATDPSLQCETCNKIVRPVDRKGEGFLTCPCCQASLAMEVDRYNHRYNMEKLMGDSQ